MAVGASLWGTVNQAHQHRVLNKGRLATQDNYARALITPESPVFFRARASGMNR